MEPGSTASTGPVLRSQGTQTVSFDQVDALSTGQSAEGLGTAHELLDIRSLADPPADADGDGTREDEQAEATLTGETAHGTAFRGSDSLCLVP